jgi:uncharacterized spore protein YtfJ
MDALEFVQQAREAVTVKRVYGDPYEREGVTFIPAATLRGMSGGGGGEHRPAGEGGAGDAGTDAGSGGGFGLMAKPAGAFVISGGTVRWQPAVDVNRIVLGGQVVAIVALLALRTFLRHRR